MRKGLIAAAAVIVLLGGGGYWGLQYGKKLIAERVMDEMVGQVLQDEEMRRLLDDPEVRRALREAASGEDLERLRAELGAQLENVAGGGDGSGGSGAGAEGGAGFDGASSASLDAGDLPVTTVEEAKALVLEKFSLGEIRRYADLLRGGLTEEEMRLIRDDALSRFSEDERRALLLVALIEAERRTGERPPER